MCRRGTTLAHDKSVRITFCSAGAMVIAAVLAGGSTLASAALADPEPNVSVEVVEGEIRAQVSLFVAAPRQRVWDILSDFERAPEYIRDLQVSNIVSRAGETLRVFQKD